MAKKAPNYEDMTASELQSAAGEHYNAIRDLRESGDGGLEVELKVAEHRAHLAVINPLRTEKNVTEELARSAIARQMRGMSDRQWDDLRQVVNNPDAIVDGAEAHTPGTE